MSNLIPCMAHVIQLALGVFMKSLHIKGCTMSWEAHERNQQFEDNQSTDIGRSQRLRKVGNARIDKVLALWPGLAKIIEKVRISRHFERPETHHQIAENAWCIDYADTWSSKQVHWMLKRQSTYPSTTYYGCENLVEYDTRDAWVGLPIIRIHPPVAQESKI